ncbi:thiamine phosphate synthase [Pseudochrobactrum algeriensis]|uniref:thiamine phosphate synthase n=1 Tax=Pseudochrobactrum algeriensis TaxID=2834768 RepID=UPI001BD060D6|nr:thiamine phosphate synthase [Pseudochrobactrum algeriensis]MBX8813985.1 thiamine phosphate synthase [Ochrobactrum sp. MR34]QVQ36414.1 thiamine phosphate synthase [Pseudochrobactrum algeriensis]QVQ39632.1 thiamine phosphate synthase [Pseudochrobactrum algeriensis]QVQ43552.1 thiamine phosphate synthase [Pseudochrobactrum algeriensis]
MKFPANRPRLVLVVPSPSSEGHTADTLLATLDKALTAGDIASVILDNGKTDEASFQAFATLAVGKIQAAGAAAIILNDTRTAGRVGADGVHIEGSLADIADAVERYTPRMIVGTGNVKERHTALEVGELQPDYMFFGKIGADTKPEAHPRNLSLAEWWAAMVEIPAILQAGAKLDDLAACFATQAEFIALGTAVFSAEDPAQVIADANRQLDEMSAAETEE